MLHLEPFTPTDFSKLISWIDSEELLIQVAGTIFTFPLTPEQLSIYTTDPDRFAFKVTDTVSGEAIGHAELYRHEANTVKICRVLIGDKASRGKGLGKELITALVSYSIHQLKIPAIELNVYDWNAPAIRCYEQVGFVFVPDKYTTVDVNGSTWKSLNMVYKG